MLVSMLSNTSGSDGIVRGFAMKHQTAINAIDTISHFYNAADMPENNKYWEKYYEKGIDVVCDNTTPMMIHLTREYMVNNSITTVGQGSDFEIITGQPYTDGAAYIFNDRIITKGEYSDGKTCQNGYIHQVENVLMPPETLLRKLPWTRKRHFIAVWLNIFQLPILTGEQLTHTMHRLFSMANRLLIQFSRSATSVTTRRRNSFSMTPMVCWWRQH